VFLFKWWISWRNGETVWTVLDIVVSSSDAINVVWYNFHLYSAQVKQQESPFNPEKWTMARRQAMWRWSAGWRPKTWKHVQSLSGPTATVSCGEFCQRWVNGWHPEGIYNYIYIYMFGLAKFTGFLYTFWQNWVNSVFFFSFLVEISPAWARNNFVKSHIQVQGVSIGEDTIDSLGRHVWENRRNR
jgi:hypothetical protein